MTGVEKGHEDRKRAIALTMMMAFIFLAFFGAVAQVALANETRQDLILRIGAQDDMKSRNFLAVSDVWSSNVLGPIYEGVGQVDPKTEEPIPYNLLGIDADDNGVFDLSEYGVYRKEANQSEVTAFYDLNGVYFHDGVQATMHDVLFAYHLNALDPLTTSLDVIKHLNNQAGSNYSTSRWLNVWPVPDIWDPQIPVGANSSLTFALHFSQEATYARFTTWTLNAGSILPRHVWEGKGRVCLDATDGVCNDWKENIHGNFKYAYNEATFNGRPDSDPLYFRFSDAESWLMEDDEVIGTGPFKFGQWTPGVTVRIDKFEDYKADAVACHQVGDPLRCEGDYYSYMHQPYIDGMLFTIYKTPQMAVFALQAGEIDVVSWSVPPEFVSALGQDPNVGIQSTAEKGFFYLSYNMRISPFGYPENDPKNGDDGLWLRRAMAHVIDKKRIVTSLLQNFGVAGDQPVSPASVKWYNGSVAKYGFDLARASQILDEHYTESFQGEAGLGWAGGYRRLPTIGTQQVEILCPQADYDPIRAQACEMIASNARAVGLNIVAKLLAFGQIVEKLNNREMQMWVLGWRIGSDPPDYYYAFFHSMNAREGQNYPGFNNETFDDLITRARAELDLEKQESIIKQCSGLLTEAQPYDVLYFRTNIEPYRSDRFTNWTVGPAGSIFGASWWSWIGIRPPVKKTMGVMLEVSSAMQASISLTETSSLAVRAKVRNLDDNTPKQGANVTISLTAPRGELVSGPQRSVVSVSGVSDINGDFIATYIAPVMNETENQTAVTLAASAEFGDEQTGQVLANIVIYPPGRPFLAVLKKWTVADVVLTKGSVPLRVEVTNQDGVPVNGAEVTVTPETAGPIVSPEVGTTSGGGVDFLITAPSKISEKQRDFAFRVQASGGGLISDPYTIVLTVIREKGSDGAFDMTLLLIGAVAVIAVIVVLVSAVAVKKRPKRRRRKAK